MCLNGFGVKANKDNEDVTGKRGADYYANVLAHSAHPERLAGSLPTVSLLLKTLPSSSPLWLHDLLSRPPQTAGAQ